MNFKLVSGFLRNLNSSPRRSIEKKCEIKNQLISIDEMSHTVSDQKAKSGNMRYYMLKFDIFKTQCYFRFSVYREYSDKSDTRAS